MQDVDFKGTIKLLSPLCHNSDETLSTDTKFRRIAVLSGGKQIRIPVYSGNAYRGLLRRVAAKQFVEILGLEKLTDSLYYTFFSGGSLKKGSSQDYIDIGEKRILRENIPFLSLFGSAIQNQIFSGKMEVGIAVPIARETFELTGKESNLSIWEQIDEIFYTRRDDLEDKEKRGKDDQAQQMKYTIEVLTPGTILNHSISLHCVNEVELSCFGHVMRKFFENGELGGKAGTGHGRVHFSYSPEIPTGEKYLAYLNENKAKILDYVNTLQQRI